MRSLTEVGRRRALVLGLALVVLALKLGVAATTFGTNDIRHWQDFAAGVARHGPVGVYGIHFARSFYNHPPLIGYLLQCLNLAADHGLSLGFTLRAASSLSDVASALLLFEVLRRRRGLRPATVGACALAASPVLFVISGFHGNTDPVFLMLTLAAVHLLADHDRPAAAGVAIGLALGVKIVPIVVVPALLVYAASRGRRPALSFGFGLVTSVGVTWLPALIGQGRAVRADVLGYRGSGVSQWGWVQISHWLGDPAWADFLLQPGRFLIVALCAGGPAVLVWRRPDRVAEAVGLALAGFLFLSPAFGTQYLVWGLAAYLFDVGWASAYNVAAGVLLGAVYSDWAGGFPWHEADWHPLNRAEVVAALVVWAGLGAALGVGLIRAWTGPAPGRRRRGDARGPTRTPAPVAGLSPARPT